MAYRWLTDLDVALADAGLSWVEVPATPIDPTGASSWRTRGRPASTGSFDPTGVLCHHTASPPGTSARSDLNVIVAGNSQAPGPIASLYIGRDAVLYLVGAGRCNHGGKGIRPGIDHGCADMNAALLGIEVGNSGMGERWSDPVCELYGRTVAALCAYYRWNVESQVFLHATTGPPEGGCNSKIDPSGPWCQQPNLPGGGAGTWNLDTWRAWCKAHAPGPPVPTPKPPEGVPVAKCIMHVDESQPSGSPGYFRFNAVWNFDGAWRYHLPSETGVRSAVYENTGDGEVFNHPLGEIVRNNRWVQPVGSLDGYGAVAGSDPGDV